MNITPDINTHIIDNYNMILVIDAEPTMRTIIADALKVLGANKVIKAATGEEALLILEEGNIDLILCDYSLPKLSGIDLLRIVRSKPMMHKIPFIIISANIDYKDIAHAIELGVSDYLVKPFTMSMLEKKLDNISNSSRKKSDNDWGLIQKIEGKSPANRKITILVVDDQIDNIKIISAMLKKDYKILIANNAKKALDICQSNNPPELMLLDIMMPKMTGLEVCKIIKDNHFTEHINVIFTTALDQTKDIVNGFEVGAVDYITKPIIPEILKARVKTHIKLIERNNQAREQIDAMIKSSKVRDYYDRLTHYELKRPIDEMKKSINRLRKSKLNNRNDKLSKLNLTHNVTLLANTVDNMLALYKIEDGNYEYHPVKFDLKKLIEDVLLAYLNTIKVQSFEIDLALQQCRVFVDQKLTSVIIANLLNFSFDTAIRGSVIKLVLSTKDNLATFTIVLASANAKLADDTIFDKHQVFQERNVNKMSLYCAYRMASIQNGSLKSFKSKTNKNQFNFNLTLVSC